MSISYRAPVPFIGVGPGRCGTTSLAKILDACEGVVCTHEHVAAPWYDTTDSCLGDLIKRFRTANADGIMCGDINQSLGRHIASLRSAIRNLKVICINRERQGCVESWLRHNGSMLRPDDKRAFMDRQMLEGPRRVCRCFPVIDGWTKQAAYFSYWDMYRAMMDEISEPVFRMDMEDLNDDSALAALFDFLEIREDKRVFPKERHHNTGAERKAKVKEQLRAYPR